MSFARENVGQRFLLMTDPAKKIGNLPGRLYWISLCSRSARIETAKPDIYFLDNRAKLTGKTRLSGTLKRFSQDPPSLASIKVSVTGPNFDKIVETDENGYFELWDLPAGKYRVSFASPSGIRVRDYRILPLDKTWRREAPPDNTIQTTLAAHKHVELIVGIEGNTGGQARF